MSEVQKHGADVAVKKESAAGEDLVGHVLIPLVLCAILALGFSCFLTFQYQSRTEWAAKASSLNAYQLGGDELTTSSIGRIPTANDKTAEQKRKVSFTNH